MNCFNRLAGTQVAIYEKTEKDNMACIKVPNGFICSGMTPPTEEHECREFGYSLGRACKKCPVECRRNGMTPKEALADNHRNRLEKLFKEKLVKIAQKLDSKAKKRKVKKSEI